MGGYTLERKLDFIAMFKLKLIASITLFRTDDCYRI